MEKTKKSQLNAILENEAFLQYLIRKHERLTILLDKNLENRKDPTEADILLLKEECEAYDKTSLPWNVHFDKSVGTPPKQMLISDDLSG